MRTAFGDVSTNLDRLETLTQKAADADAKLVVSPECAIPGYCADDLRTIWQAPERKVHEWFQPHDVQKVAESIPGPITDRLGAIAAKTGVYLLGGLIEAEAGRFYNAAVLVSPDGRVVARHRKRRPWPAIEPAWATYGDAPPVRFQTPWGIAGIAICYDIHWIRQLYAKGDLWALLFPAGWIDDEPPTKYFDHRFGQVARHLQSHVIFANHSLPEPTRWLGSGSSTIYRADGAIAARSPLEFGDDVVIAELPVAR